MRRIGVLSDTHLTCWTELFQRQVDHAFAGCETILHAGDLTDLGILKAFTCRELHAVQGNCCCLTAQQALPRHKFLTIGKFSIGLCHGAWNQRESEDRLLQLFPTADCIVYGHSHIPEQKRIGRILLVNPGSFQGTGRYGAAGTYAQLLVEEGGISATLHELPFLS